MEDQKDNSLISRLKNNNKIKLKYVDFTSTKADKLFENLEKSRERLKRDFEIDIEDLKRIKFTI